tara:strand:- start:145 stop:321 length:177 start_codon:yes stop_codon:yes gene_type:complete
VSINITFLFATEDDNEQKYNQSRQDQLRRARTYKFDQFAYIAFIAFIALVIGHLIIGK